MRLPPKTLAVVVRVHLANHYSHNFSGRGWRGGKERKGGEGQGRTVWCDSGVRDHVDGLIVHTLKRSVRRWGVSNIGH